MLMSNVKISDGQRIHQIKSVDNRSQTGQCIPSGGISFASCDQQCDAGVFAAKHTSQTDAAIRRESKSARGVDTHGFFVQTRKSAAPPDSSIETTLLAPPAAAALAQSVTARVAAKQCLQYGWAKTHRMIRTRSSDILKV